MVIPYKNSVALLLRIQTAGFNNVILKYIDSTTFQIYIPQGTDTCMDQDLIAFNNQIILFSLLSI